MQRGRKTSGHLSVYLLGNPCLQLHIESRSFQRIPEKEILKLSDSFINPSDNPEVELTCTVLNINPSYNEQLKEKSKALSGYMYFVNRVRDNLIKQNEISRSQDMQEEDLEAAIYEAIDNCIERHILEDFLRENRNEMAKKRTTETDAGKVLGI